MSRQNRQIQESEHYETILIDANAEHTTTIPVKICWNTGEEKNCIACCLRKGCKART